MTATLERTLTAAGIPSEVELMLADAGYCSEYNPTSPGPDRLIATTKDDKQRRAARELGRPPVRHPPTPPPSRRWSTSCAPRKAPPLRPALPPDRTDLRRPQAQPRDPPLPPPRPERRPQRMGVHPPRRQHAQLYQHRAAAATA